MSLLRGCAAPSLFVFILAGLVGCNGGAGTGDNSGNSATGKGSSDRVSIAFVTNQIASFWNIAKVGCEDAAKDFDVDVDVRMPAVATAVEQKRIRSFTAHAREFFRVQPHDVASKKKHA